MKRRTIFASLILALLATAPLSFAQQVTLSTPLRYVHTYSLTGPLFTLQHAATATGNLQEWRSTAGVTMTSVGATGNFTLADSALFTFPNGVVLSANGANLWDGIKLTKSTATGPTVGNEGVGVFIENNRTAAIDDQATLTGVEGVTRARAPGRNLTIRGGHFRTYIDDTLGGTAITSVGLDASARASGAVIAEAGTAFVGLRVYMAPGFTAPTLANVTNHHGVWVYNEHATNAVTNAYFANDAGAGYTYGLSFFGATIAATGAQIRLSNNVRLSTGAATTRDAVRAAVGTGGEIGSTYYSTTGKIYLKVANADATADWERVTTSAAD